MQTNRALFLPNGASRPTRVSQPMTDYKALGVDTGGAYSFAEHRLVLDFPPHVHDREDEGIYVVEGSMTATVGEETYSLGPGDFVFLPKGVPHSLTNRSDPAARFVFVSSPGGFEHLMDDFVEAAVAGIQPGSAEWLEIEDRHGLHFVRP